MSQHRKLTRQQLCDEASEAFGKNPLGWAFECPNCGDIATGAQFREALISNPRKNKSGETVIASDILGQECIGRIMGALKKGVVYDGRGCDWTSYGLFPGPWEVELAHGGHMWAFPLADGR